jgi:steroid delta-isomerase-like uncharacterized protein
MSVDENKAAAKRILEQAFNYGSCDAIDTGFTPDALIHDPGLEMRGPAELRQRLIGLRTAFPDFHFVAEDHFAEGDQVAIRYRAEGTHSAQFLGIPASGKRINYTGIVILRFERGKIAEFWAQPDQLGVLKQLGARVEAA